MRPLNKDKKQELRKLADQYPWIVAYIPINTARSSVGGRPASPFPRKVYNCQLSTDENQRLTKLQDFLSSLVGRQIPRGETVGLLLWSLSDKFNSATQKSAEKKPAFEEFLDMFLKSASEKNLRLEELSKAYPYLRMYAASMKTTPFSQKPYSIAPKRKSVSLRLTKSEAKMLSRWTELLNPIVGDELQRGEVVGFLTWLIDTLLEEYHDTSDARINSLESFLKITENNL